MKFDSIPYPASADSDSSTAQEARTPASVAKRTLLWVLPAVLAVLIGILFGVGFAMAIRVPEVERVFDLQPGVITQLYDRDGSVLQEYSTQRRELLQEGEVPEMLQNALLASEDRNFFEHGGVDAWGVARAAWVDFLEGRKAQGASTITMQLARELFYTKERTWRRKISEAFTAVELEKRLSKQQILTLYCNLMNLGAGNYGMQAAARSYFNKDVDDLNAAEAATLVAVLKRPSEHNPYSDPDAVLKRRNLVLGGMLEEGYLSEAEYEEAVEQPLLVVKRRRERRLAPYFSEEIRRYLYDTYGATGLYERGLQVRTTLDRDIQRAAEDALRDGLLRLDHDKGWRGEPLVHLEDGDLKAQELPSWDGESPVPGRWYEGIVLDVGSRTARVKIENEVFELTPEGYAWTERRSPRALLEAGDVAWFRLEVREEVAEPLLVLEQEPELEGAVVVLESATGAVRAMVGGWDFRRNEFNRVTQAKRQVGSAFKPFVYGAAFEMGYTPADTLFDAPVVFPGADNVENYSPRNYYRERYYGILTLRKALEKSINVTAVKLQDLVGVDRVIEFAHRCGISSDLPPYPSLALGAADISPLELAAAYATFSNQGMHVEPYLYESITTPTGRVLEEHLPRASKAMEPEIAYVLTHVLEGVIDRGTAARANDLELDLAGKTGTTDAYTDAWFAGYTPRYTVLAWVGYDKQRTLGRNMTGAEAALPIWHAVISRGIEEGWIEKGERFTAPPGIELRQVEYHTGLLPAPGAERTITEAFVAGTEPAQLYDRQWATILSLPWFQQRPFYGIPKEGEQMPEDTEDWTLVKEAWAER